MQPNGYRPDIDGLRALAIVPVLLFHAGVPGLSGGFVGVDVFFVISGYLISKHIYEELAGNKFSLLGFYERRTRRIAPAFFATAFATAILASILVFPTELVEFAKSFLWSALALGNVYFWQESGYFAPAAESQPLLHFWSLGVEEQFYFLFPALAILGWKLGVRRFGWLVALVLLASLAASEWTVRRSPDAAFYLLPFRAWELLLGSMLALPTFAKPSSATIAGGAVALGVAMIGTAVVRFSDATLFPGVSALLPVVGCALAIWGGERVNAASRMLGIAPLTYIGRISYSLYLVHWPVLFFSKLLFPDAGQGVLTLGVIVVSFLLADLSYRFVETPTRQRKDIWTRWRVFGATAAAVVVSVVAAFALIGSGGLIQRLPADAQAILAYRYNQQEAYREGVCFLQRQQTKDDLDAARCLPESGRIAAIWGDSHAAHLVPGLMPRLESDGYTVAQLTASGCPPILDAAPARRIHCRDFNDFAFGWLRDKKPSLVVMSAIWPAEETAFQKLREEIATLSDNGTRVVVFGPGPIFPQRVPELLARRLAGGDANARQTLPEQARLLDDALAAALKDTPATYVSVQQLMCPQGACDLLREGEPIYWDAEHLTTAGSALLTDKAAASLALAR